LVLGQVECIVEQELNVLNNCLTFARNVIGDLNGLWVLKVAEDVGYFLVVGEEVLWEESNRSSILVPTALLQVRSGFTKSTVLQAVE
jgi:hypothetical protein